MGPPVIKDLRYMDHFPGLLHTAENEIIILGAVKFPAESRPLSALRNVLPPENGRYNYWILKDPG